MCDCKKLSQIAAIAALAVSLIGCVTLPDDPMSNPDNSIVTIESINNNEPEAPYSVLVDDTVHIDLTLRLPKFMDSVTASITSADNVLENRYLIVTEPDTTSIHTSLVFSTPGAKKCIMTVFRTNSTTDTCSLIFDVDTPYVSDTLPVVPGTEDTITAHGFRFLASDDQVEITEGTIKTIHLSVTETANLPITFTIVNKPHFAGFTEEDTSIAVTLAPDFSVVPTGIDYKDSLIIISASNNDTTLLDSVVLRIIDVNRPPAFTSFPPDTVFVVPGDTVRTNPLEGRDPDNNAFYFELVSEIDGMQLYQDRTIRWAVPEKYGVDSSCEITVRITDGEVFEDRTFTIIIKE